MRGQIRSVGRILGDRVSQTSSANSCQKMAGKERKNEKMSAVKSKREPSTDPPQPTDQTRSQHVTRVCFCMWCHSSALTMLVCVPACEPAGRTDSPMTTVVIWLLLVPCLFLTSQTKVVLTALSTFFTVSLLSSTITVSGSDPDILDRKERIFSDPARDKEIIKQRKN